MALTITRREGERLILTYADAEIVLTFHDLRQSRLRVSIDAPLDVNVIRGEIEETAQTDGGEAANDSRIPATASPGGRG